MVTDAFMEDFAKMTIGVGAKSYHVVAQGFAVYDNVHNGAIKNTGGPPWHSVSAPHL